MDIIELLKSRGAIGKNNAITTQAIMVMLCTNEKRVVTKAVEDARDRGDIVCALMTGEGGYYLPASIKEMESYLRAQGSRLKHSASRYRAACDKVASLKDSANQGDLFEEVM